MMQSTKIIIRPPRVRFFSHQFKSFICENRRTGQPDFRRQFDPVKSGGFFMVRKAASLSVQGQRGGCTRKKRGGVPAPLSLNSFVFCGLSLLICFPRADTEKSGETIATPPKRGVPTGPDSGPAGQSSIRPQGVAIVGIYPCGKARKRRPGGGGAGRDMEPMKWRLRQWARTPFPLALDDSRSVLAVKGSLRRFAPWTAAGRSEGDGCLRGKGGVLFSGFIPSRDGSDFGLLIR